jgi:hypothetical protein
MASGAAHTMAVLSAHAFQITAPQGCTLRSARSSCSAPSSPPRSITCSHDRLSVRSLPVMSTACTPWLSHATMLHLSRPPPQMEISAAGICHRRSPNLISHPSLRLSRAALPSATTRSAFSRALTPVSLIRSALTIPLHRLWCTDLGLDLFRQSLLTTRSRSLRRHLRMRQ